MAGNIKGIVIEFSGDTTKLDKALRQIKNSTKDIDAELKQVNKALKFNPTSVELWRQKQDLLRQKIKQTEDNLKELKNIQAQMDAQGIDKQSEAYRRISREIVESESKLKSFNTELRKIGQVNLRAMSEQFKDMGNKLTAAGQSMRGISTAAAALAASIGALTVKSGKWADDMNTMSKVYSIGTKELQQYSAAAELVDVSVETIAKSHVKLEKQMLTASKGTGASAEAFKALGVSVTNADGSLRNGDAVWQDTIAALGQMENETERDAYAMQLMGRSAAELNPLIEDGGEAYQQLAETMAKYNLDFIDQEILDQANAFNDSLDTIKAVGLVAFQQLGTQLAAYLAPAMEKVVDVVGRLANWFSQLSPRTQAIIGGIAAVVAVVAPLLIGLGKVSFAISSIISLVAVVGPAIAGVVAALGPVILIIAGVVAAGITLYKNWDTIKAKAIAFKDAVVATFNNFKAQVSATFNAIKTAIVTPIQTAINTIKGIIDRIKGWFPISIGKIFSNIKLPHFRLSGSFSLKNMTVPKISIDWYKTGGIFDSPSIIGVGEAGSEAVVPLDKLWDKLDNLQGETNIVININGANADPREIAQEVKRVLIMETNQRRLAWQ
ncbi:MAG: hypothetical protein IIZ78_02870 [Clostridiales bacterium]|nr:hypothetical protein [Clostridiales bacterium]